MEPNALQFAERLEAAARSFRRTRLWMLAVTLVALAGIVCYAVFGHDMPVCFGVLVLAGWVLVAGCALCWLGYCCKRLLGICSESHRRLSETELTLYQEAVRHERSVRDKQSEAAGPDPEIAAKRRKVELAWLEKELQSLR